MGSQREFFALLTVDRNLCVYSSLAAVANAWAIKGEALGAIVAGPFLTKYEAQKARYHDHLDRMSQAARRVKHKRKKKVKRESS